jgi:hypothetical protein
MDTPNVWCRTVDLQSGRCIRIFPGGRYWAFVEEGYGDFEISFKPEDGRAILALLEQALASTPSIVGSSPGEFLVHRFINQDGGEGAAFLVRERLGGVEITFVDELDDADDPTMPDAGGMSVCISRAEARTLTDTFIGQLKALADASQAAIPTKNEPRAG